MLLAIDVGNTHTLFALCDAQDVRHSWRVATDLRRTEDETAALLHVLLQREALSFEAINAVIIACVVPDVLFALTLLARRYCGCEALVVGKDTTQQLMPVHIDNPHELGADRLVNAYGAWRMWQRAAIIIDFGTATTFDVVSSGGAYVGGAIAPGVNLSLEALTQAAARLHGVAIREPHSAIGKNTTHAMQSGVYFGYLGLVNELIRRIQSEMPEADYVVATGGLAELFSRNNPLIDVVKPDLTLYGLVQSYSFLQKDIHGL